MQKQEGFKYCPDCEKTKDITEFYKNGKYYFTLCKKCHNQKSIQWQKNNPGAKRANNLQQHYGITLAEYARLFEEQNGVCASCGQPETKNDPRTKQLKNLHVDHSHKTGKIRALLCYACNAALGMLQDDPARIQFLLQYAKKHQEQETQG